MGTTSRESSPVCGLWPFCLTIPGSTTKTTPSTVTLVSAMLVATTTRRQPGGPGANTLACRAAEAGVSRVCNAASPARCRAGACQEHYIKWPMAAEAGVTMVCTAASLARCRAGACQEGF